MRKQHAMISNIWGDTKVVCMNHEPPKEMEVIEYHKQMIYICPDAYNKENQCVNHLTVNDFNKMLDHLCDLIVTAEMEDRSVNLQNYQWKDRNGIRFKVLKHTNDEMLIGVDNKKRIEIR